MYKDSLVGWWDMSTINPPNLAPRTHGTSDGIGTGLVVATDIVDGVGGGMATEYDGLEYTTIADEGNFDFERTDAFTLACWMKPRDVVGARALISKTQDDAGPGWVFHQQLQALDIYLVSAGVDRIVVRTANVFTAGRWYHVAMSYTGSATAAGVSLYVNGVYQIPALVIDALTASILNGDSVMFAIGAALGHPYPGVLDTVQIFDAALTNLQVTDLVAATKEGRF